MTETSGNNDPRVLLDTSIQIDRIKTGARRRRIDELLSGFQFRFSTDISLLEFKATVIEQCVTIHAELRRKQKFTSVRDALIEKNHRQVSLRAHIFNNIINVFGGSSFEVAPDADRRLAEKARLSLEDAIPRLYKEFRTGVDSVLTVGVSCDRAREQPVKKRVAFDTNLPRCRRGKNKSCTIEAFIRKSAPKIAAVLDQQAGESEQLKKTQSLFNDVIANQQRELSHSECRSAGDALIILQGCEHATHAASTNAREWAPLASATGVKFLQVTYPDEVTGVPLATD